MTAILQSDATRTTWFAIVGQFNFGSLTSYDLRHDLGDAAALKPYESVRVRSCRVRVYLPPAPSGYFSFGINSYRCRNSAAALTSPHSFVLPYDTTKGVVHEFTHTFDELWDTELKLTRLGRPSPWLNFCNDGYPESLNAKTEVKDGKTAYAPDAVYTLAASFQVYFEVSASGHSPTGF